MYRVICILLFIFICCQTFTAANKEESERVEEKKKAKFPKTCQELRKQGYKKSGVYTIYPDGKEYFSLEVYCDQVTEGGGWLVFQRRMDGTVDFYRNWNNYKLGFGEVDAEFWLGNDKLAMLLDLHDNHELRIDMESTTNEQANSKYNSFDMGDESTNYQLSVSGYSSTSAINPGDSLSTHNGQPFSTFDKDNDAAGSNCADKYKGGWWYRSCHWSNLNGLYLNGATELFAQGVVWYTWKGHSYSLKSTEMKFRPVI